MKESMKNLLKTTINEHYHKIPFADALCAVWFLIKKNNMSIELKNELVYKLFGTADDTTVSLQKILKKHFKLSEIFGMIDEKLKNIKGTGYAKIDERIALFKMENTLCNEIIDMLDNNIDKSTARRLVTLYNDFYIRNRDCKHFVAPATGNADDDQNAKESHESVCHLRAAQGGSSTNAYASVDIELVANSSRPQSSHAYSLKSRGC